jgi:hypothetical protein
MPESGEWITLRVVGPAGEVPLSGGHLDRDVPGNMFQNSSLSFFV